MKNKFLSLILACAILAPGLALAVPTTISVVNMPQAVTALADNAADTSNGNRFLNYAGDAFIIARNTHAANSSTITVTAQKTSITYPGLGAVTVADKSIVLAAGAVKVVGPLPAYIWNDSSGYVQLTYSGTGTVLVSPMRSVLP